VSLADSLNATIVKNVLTMTATVYSRTGNTGPFNLVVKSGLACRLEAVNRNPQATGAQRRELANLGDFRYDATYDIPETGIQIEVDAYPGKRWNPTGATGWPDIVPGIGTIGKSIEVTRAL
jgi:hypothetical protein